MSSVPIWERLPYRHSPSILCMEGTGGRVKGTKKFRGLLRNMNRFHVFLLICQLCRILKLCRYGNLPMIGRCGSSGEKRLMESNAWSMVVVTSCCGSINKQMWVGLEDRSALGSDNKTISGCSAVAEKTRVALHHIENVQVNNSSECWPTSS